MGSWCTVRGTGNRKGEPINRPHRAWGGAGAGKREQFQAPDRSQFKSGDKFQDMGTEVSLKANLSPQEAGAGKPMEGLRPS